MPKFINVIIGAAAIVAGVALEIATLGSATPLIIAIYSALITAGTGMALSGVGTLISGAAGGSQSQSGGIAWATRNPTKSWDVLYGRACTGGMITHLPDDEADCHSS